MKKITGLLLSIFIASTAVGQDINNLCSFSKTPKAERIVDLQVTPEAVYLLTHTLGGSNKKRIFDHFVIYTFNINQTESTHQILDAQMEELEGMEYIGFLNNTWFYLTEKIIDSYTFEYALISISTEGTLTKEVLKTIELPKSSRKHVDDGRPGLIGHGRWLGILGGVRFAQTQKSFLVSIRISHTTLLAFVFNEDGTLKSEKEILFVNNGEKVSPSDVLAIDAALIDDNDNLYFVLSKYGEGYSRYCSVVNDEVFSVKETHSKKRINSALFSNANDISALTLSNNGYDVTALLNTFQEDEIRLENKFNYDFGDYVFLNKESLAKKDEQVFLASQSKMVGDYDYLFDLVLFSLSENGIENFAKVDRLINGYAPFDIEAQVWPYEENYYVLFNSYKGRPQAVGGMFLNTSMYLTKLDAQLKEIKTIELNFMADMKYAKQLDNKIYMILNDFKVITLDLSSM